MALPLRLSSFIVSILCGLALTAHASESPPPDLHRRFNTLADEGLTSASVMLHWNGVVRQTFREQRVFPPQAARALAMVHGAGYDAALAASRDGATSAALPYQPYLGAFECPAEAEPEWAAAAAMAEVLEHLFPKLTSRYEEALALYQPGPEMAKCWEASLLAGREAAARMIEARAHDGSQTPDPWRPPARPKAGEWRTTRPTFRPPLLPEWRALQPFVMESPEQFRCVPPPDITSAQFAEELNLVRDIGAYFSDSRTAEQEKIACFWADAQGTFTPTGHWNQIAETAVRLRAGAGEPLTPLEQARLFAQLNLAMADAGIACWEAKYHYNYWRPVTAIALADQDGNAATGEPDSRWTPYIATPPFPEFPSGHSTFSGAAEAVLTHWFGEDFAFEDLSDDLERNHGDRYVVRQYASFRAAAEEASKSRIYGGIHYPSASKAGLESGRAVGRYVVGQSLLPAGETPVVAPSSAVVSAGDSGTRTTR
ncbi:MAG: vanadium-dependent haloperoxidase [Sumerlaeia bacterium]